MCPCFPESQHFVLIQVITGLSQDMCGCWRDIRLHIRQKHRRVVFRCTKCTMSMSNPLKERMLQCYLNYSEAWRACMSYNLAWWSHLVFLLTGHFKRTVSLAPKSVSGDLSELNAGGNWSCCPLGITYNTEYEFCLSSYTQSTFHFFHSPTCPLKLQSL